MEISGVVKRQLHGTYISVEPYHLFRYLDEQSFRYNGRKLTDAERFAFVCNQIAGRRLTWNGSRERSERGDCIGEGAETSGARQASPLTPSGCFLRTDFGAFVSLLRSREPVEVLELCACRFRYR